MIESVVFDVGETLVNETREYGTWADWLGVPRHTFSAIFALSSSRAGIIARLSNTSVLASIWIPSASSALKQADQNSSQRLYPDARPGMAALREMGVWVGVAGNQTARGEDSARTRSSCRSDRNVGRLGRGEAGCRIFQAIISAAPCLAERILYVGDRLDNDLKPARAAGMRTAFIRRGPWGYIWENHPHMPSAADFRVASLIELPALVTAANRSGN